MNRLLLLTLLLASAGAVHAQVWDTNQITWTAPTTCTSGQPIANCPVTGYRVERASSQTGTFAALGTSTTTSYTHTGAVAGPNCYRVIAISAKGESVPSNVACKTNVEPSGPPNPPTNLTVVNNVAYTIRPDFQHFAFVKSVRWGKVRLGAACDESRTTGDGYYVVSSRRMVTPTPPEGQYVVAKCG